MKEFRLQELIECDCQNKATWEMESSYMKYNQGRKRPENINGLK